MAKTLTNELEKNKPTVSAIELALARREAEDGIDSMEFETDSELMGQENEMLYQFIRNRNLTRNSNKVFFKINNRPILGAKGQQVKGGAIPLFAGAAIDLSSLNAIGDKKFLKPPEASGKGGILAIMPQKFNQGLTLPFNNIKLKENFIDGDILLNNRSGFHGSHIRLTAEKIHVTMDKAEFVNPRLVYTKKDEESSVPVPEDVYVDGSGITPKLLTNYLRLKAPEEVVTDTTAQEETPDEVLEKELEYKAPDRVLFMAPGGRFRSKLKGTKLGWYDSFSVERKNGGLVAIIVVKGKKNEIDISETDVEHKYTADSLTVELEDKIGILNGILGLAGFDKAENDTNEICYRDLEITEDGIFFGSIRDSRLGVDIGDDWEFKIGNTTEFEFSNLIIGKDDDDGDSYFDLATTVLKYFNIIKDDPDEEGESEEEAEDENNKFNYSVTFLTFPVIPGLVSVDAKFNAGASVGYKVRGSVNNIAGALKNQQSETFGLDLGAAITGSAYAGLKAGITAGPSFLMNVSANIGAKIALTGGEGNNVLSAGVHTEFKKGRKGMPHFEKIEFDALGELRLRALVEGSIDAQILGWEKTLCSYTFKDWELAAIAAEIKATKQNGQKWQAEANMSYRALAGKVKGGLESGDDLEKMFEKKDASYGKKAFDASQSSFEDAKNILMAYHDKSQPMFVNLKDVGSGFLNMNDAIRDIQRRFYVQLRDNENAIALQMQEVEDLKKDKDYKKVGDKIQSKINRHSGNIAKIAQSLEKIQQSSTNSVIPTSTPSTNLMDAYVAGGGNQQGFYAYLKEKAKRQAVTVDSLISYEVSRRNELTRKSNERIEQMRAFAKSLGVSESDTTKGSQLLNKYKSLGGKAINKAAFTDISALRKYEEERLREKSANVNSFAADKYHSHLDRINELSAQFPEIVKNGSNVPNAQFYKYYVDVLGARHFKNILDTYSNRERLLAYERSILSQKLISDEDGKNAFEKRGEIRELQTLGVRDKIQQARLEELVATGITQMSGDKKAYYMAATTDDLIEALIQSDRAEALKLLIKRKKEENKNSKNKKWVYDSIKSELTIDDLIEYERKRIANLEGKKFAANKKQKHQARLNFLEMKKNEAEVLRAADPQNNSEQAEKILYNAIQQYFSFDNTAGAAGFLDNVIELAEKGDSSVQRLFRSEQWVPDESKDIKALRKSDGSVYEQLRAYGRKNGTEIDHDKNKDILKAYLKSKGQRAYTAEDLDRYYTYQIHRAAAADFGSNTKADHVAVLNAIEKINDYPEMLKVYKSMGRGSSFLKHEQKEAGSWVTPDMILGYERNRMQSIYQKHYDRIEALKAAETGTDEEKAQAAKEYAETAKRFDKIGSDISLQISLNDIIAAEELKQSVKMSIHDRRIEELISTDENLTDEDKIRAYDGTRFEPAKEDVERIYNELYSKITFDPKSMAEELTSYETKEKENQEDMQKKWKQLETDTLDRIMLLAQQSEQCLKVIHDTENVINNPSSVFASEESTNEYIENVLDKTQNDIKSIPEVIKDTE